MPATPRAGAAPPSCWIGLHPPALSLESFATTLPADAQHTPQALLDTASSAAVVMQANAAARQCGIRIGMKRATALALAPQLLLGQADAARDAKALTAVAHAALAFTPSVAMPPSDDGPGASPALVLLEVQASLRYFGGLAKLLRKLRAALAPLGHVMQLASAPTALGAAWLARSAPPDAPRHCRDLTSLHIAIDEVPVEVVGPGREHWDALQGMGLRTVADLRCLPRSGITRRFGAGLLDQIDRARGDRPDAHEWIVAPSRFDSRLELHARADTTAQVLHGAQRLLAELVAWAAAAHVRVRAFDLVMHHEPRRRSARPIKPGADADGEGDATHTTLPIALAQPSREPEHLLVLLRERLARTPLAAPTLELSLHCHEVAHTPPPHGELFASAGAEREGFVRLIERLQARLGPGQVQRIVPQADHRPEYGQTMQPVDPATLLRAAPRRAPSASPGSLPASSPSGRSSASTPVPCGPPGPMWLLPEPQPLSEREHQPCLSGEPLQLRRGPERIESGWWDGALAERDYYIAECPDGSLVWIFRGRLPRADGAGAVGWYLHGRFA